MPIDKLLTTYKQHHPDTQPVIIGNGVAVFKAAIQEQLPDAISINQAAPDLETLAHMARAAWDKKETATMLLPLYLKTMQYQQST